MNHQEHISAMLGHCIRAGRYRKRLSQEQLAEASGLHRTYIGVVERGEKNITVVNCNRIASALGIRLSDLIGMVEDPRSALSLKNDPDNSEQGTLS